jgi:hypothetical protein
MMGVRAGTGGSNKGKLKVTGAVEFVTPHLVEEYFLSEENQIHHQSEQNRKVGGSPAPQYHEKYLTIETRSCQPGPGLKRVPADSESGIGVCLNRISRLPAGGAKPLRRIYPAPAPGESQRPAFRTLGVFQG